MAEWVADYPRPCPVCPRRIERGEDMARDIRTGRMAHLACARIPPTPEQIGAEVRAGLREQCGATQELGGRVWICRAARHDRVQGTRYGQSESHRWAALPT